jgi:hypothetical protein
MPSSQEAAARLLAIDELQDDLLRQLEELERRTEAVLAECVAAAGSTASKGIVASGNIAKATSPLRQRERKAA